MKKEYLEKGKPLRRAGIFQILAEESWRDGEVSSADSQRLEGLRKYLRLENQKAMAILDLAEEKYREGKIGSLRDFSAKQCYARAVRYAYSDDPELSDREKKYLKGLRSALGLSRKDHEKVLERLRKKGWEPGVIMTSIDPDAPGGDSVIQRAVEAVRVRADDPDQSILVDTSTTEGMTPEERARLGMTIDVGEIPAEAQRAQPTPFPGIPRVPPPEEEPSADPSLPDPGGDAEPSADPSLPDPGAAAPDPLVADALPEPDPDEPPSGEIEVAPDVAPAPERPPPRAPRPPPAEKPRQVVRRPRTLSMDFLSPARKAALTRVAGVVFLLGAMVFLVRSLPSSGPVTPGGVSDDYRNLAATYGSNGVRVRALRVRGPDPPNGPALDLGEAWDLHAGQDGFLYGTATYRIFRIDPKTGRATWVAGTGRLGEPEDGAPALESMMDPASPQVDRDGNVYFRQGNSAIFVIEPGEGPDPKGILRRVFGTREVRAEWKDGDAAGEARPGAIEQIALDQAGRIYFDEYSGGPNSPEVLGRIEVDARLRGLFLFALTPIEHPFRRLMKTFIGTGNGFENLTLGLDGGVYFAVGDRLYSWLPGAGPSNMIVQPAPVDFAAAKDGSLLVVTENRIERWVGMAEWTREHRDVTVVAGGNPEGVPSTRYQGAIPGTAAAYLQPRDLTMGPDGTLYVLDGSSGGIGLSEPRIDVIENVLEVQGPAE